jgi:hypothetical protein
VTIEREEKLNGGSRRYCIYYGEKSYKVSGSEGAQEMPSSLSDKPNLGKVKSLKRDVLSICACFRVVVTNLLQISEGYETTGDVGSFPVV